MARTQKKAVRNRAVPPYFARLHRFARLLSARWFFASILHFGTGSRNRGTEFRAVPHTHEPEVRRRFVGASPPEFPGSRLPKSIVASTGLGVLRYVAAENST